MLDRGFIPSPIPLKSREWFQPAQAMYLSLYTLLSLDYYAVYFRPMKVKWLVVEPKERNARWQKMYNGDESLYWACVCKGDAPLCVRILLWRDDSSCVLIGAAGTWRSDWRRRDIGVLIGQSVCRLLASAPEAIDSTRTRASGNLHSAATKGTSEKGFFIVTNL